MLPFATLGREAIPFLRQLHHFLRRAAPIASAYTKISFTFSLTCWLHGRLQVSHRRFQVHMSQPLLHCAQIDTSPQTPRCERCAERADCSSYQLSTSTSSDSLLTFRGSGSRAPYTPSASSPGRACGSREQRRQRSSHLSDPCSLLPAPVHPSSGRAKTTTALPHHTRRTVFSVLLARTSPALLPYSVRPVILADDIPNLIRF